MDTNRAAIMTSYRRRAMRSSSSRSGIRFADMVSGVRYAFWCIVGALVRLWALNPVSLAVRRWRQLHRLNTRMALSIRPRVIDLITDYFLSDERRKRKLLHWVKSILPWVGEEVFDFTACWQDGIVLCALMESISPGACPRYNLLKPHHRVNNCRLGIQLALRYLQVTQVTLSPEEMAIADEDSEVKIVHLVQLLKWKYQKQGNRPREFHNVIIEEPLPCKCQARGTGIRAGIVGRRTKFNILADTVTRLDLQIEIRGPNNEYNREKIVSMYPSATSRFRDHVISTTASCSEDDGKTKVIDDGAGHSFVRQKSLDDDTGHLVIPFDYQCVGEGRFLVTYIPRSAGLHYITVLSQGCHIQGSPFEVKVSDWVSSLNIIPKQRVVPFDMLQSIEETPKDTLKPISPSNKLRRQLSHVAAVSMMKRRILKKVITQNGEKIICDVTPSPTLSRQSSFSDVSEDERRKEERGKTSSKLRPPKESRHKMHDKEGRETEQTLTQTSTRKADNTLTYHSSASSDEKKASPSGASESASNSRKLDHHKEMKKDSTIDNDTASKTNSEDGTSSKGTVSPTDNETGSPTSSQYTESESSIEKKFNKALESSIRFTVTQHDNEPMLPPVPQNSVSDTKDGLHVKPAETTNIHEVIQTVMKLAKEKKESPRSAAENSKDAGSRPKTPVTSVKSHLSAGMSLDRGLSYLKGCGTSPTPRNTLADVEDKTICALLPPAIRIQPSTPRNTTPKKEPPEAAKRSDFNNMQEVKEKLKSLEEDLNSAALKEEEIELKKHQNESKSDKYISFNNDENDSRESAKGTQYSQQNVDSTQKAGKKEKFHELQSGNQTHKGESETQTASTRSVDDQQHSLDVKSDRCPLCASPSFPEVGSLDSITVNESPSPISCPICCSPFSPIKVLDLDETGTIQTKSDLVKIATDDIADHELRDVPSRSSECSCPDCAECQECFGDFSEVCQSNDCKICCGSRSMEISTDNINNCAQCCSRCSLCSPGSPFDEQNDSTSLAKRNLSVREASQETNIDCLECELERQRDNTKEEHETMNSDVTYSKTDSVPQTPKRNIKEKGASKPESFKKMKEDVYHTPKQPLARWGSLGSATQEPGHTITWSQHRSLSSERNLRRTQSSGCKRESVSPNSLTMSKTPGDISNNRVLSKSSCDNLENLKKTSIGDGQVKQWLASHTFQTDQNDHDQTTNDFPLFHRSSSDPYGKGKNKYFVQIFQSENKHRSRPIQTKKFSSSGRHFLSKDTRSLSLPEHPDFEFDVMMNDSLGRANLDHEDPRHKRRRLAKTKKWHTFDFDSSGQWGSEFHEVDFHNIVHDVAGNGNERGCRDHENLDDVDDDEILQVVIESESNDNDDEEKESGYPQSNAVVKHVENTYVVTEDKEISKISKDKRSSIYEELTNNVSIEQPMVTITSPEQRNVGNSPLSVDTGKSGNSDWSDTELDCTPGHASGGRSKDATRRYFLNGNWSPQFVDLYYHGNASAETPRHEVPSPSKLSVTYTPGNEERSSSSKDLKTSSSCESSLLTNSREVKGSSESENVCSDTEDCKAYTGTASTDQRENFSKHDECSKNSHPNLVFGSGDENVDLDNRKPLHEEKMVHANDQNYAALTEHDKQQSFGEHHSLERNDTLMSNVDETAYQDSVFEDEDFIAFCDSLMSDYLPKISYDNGRITEEETAPRRHLLMSLGMLSPYSSKSSSLASSFEEDFRTPKPYCKTRKHLSQIQNTYDTFGNCSNTGHVYYWWQNETYERTLTPTKYRKAHSTNTRAKNSQSKTMPQNEEGIFVPELNGEAMPDILPGERVLTPTKFRTLVTSNKKSHSGISESPVLNNAETNIQEGGTRRPVSLEDNITSPLNSHTPVNSHQPKDLNISQKPESQNDGDCCNDSGHSTYLSSSDVMSKGTNTNQVETSVRSQTNQGGRIHSNQKQESLSYSNKKKKRLTKKTSSSSGGKSDKKPSESQKDTKQNDLSRSKTETKSSSKRRQNVNQKSVDHTSSSESDCPQGNEVPRYPQRVANASDARTGGNYSPYLQQEVGYNQQHHLDFNNISPSDKHGFPLVSAAAASRMLTVVTGVDPDKTPTGRPDMLRTAQKSPKLSTRPQKSLSLDESRHHQQHRIRSQHSSNLQQSSDMPHSIPDKAELSTLSDIVTPKDGLGKTQPINLQIHPLLDHPSSPQHQHSTLDHEQHRHHHSHYDLFPNQPHQREQSQEKQHSNSSSQNMHSSTQQQQPHSHRYQPHHQHDHHQMQQIQQHHRSQEQQNHYHVQPSPLSSSLPPPQPNQHVALQPVQQQHPLHHHPQHYHRLQHFDQLQQQRRQQMQNNNHHHHHQQQQNQQHHHHYQQHHYHNHHQQQQQQFPPQQHPAAQQHELPMYLRRQSTVDTFDSGITEDSSNFSQSFQNISTTDTIDSGILDDRLSMLFQLS